jgi:iron complex transport system substrate-binding protein
MPQRLRALREKERGHAPRVSRGFFFAQKFSSREGSLTYRGNRILFCGAITAALATCSLALFAAHAVAQVSAPSDEKSAATIFRTVTDETGRTVKIPQPVSRIVSLAPSLTETIYALGLQDKLVGDTDYCDYPPDAQKKQKVGGAINPSLEEIAHLHPDLVLVTRHLNTLDTVHSLDALGIATYGTDPRNVDEIISSTRRLAEILGAADAGESLANDLQKRLAVLQQKIGATVPRRVLFVVWSDPLISIGKDTFIADALRKAGAESIVDSKQDWPQVNLEEVARLQPEVLVFAESHSEATPRNFDVLATRPAWRTLDAVRNRKYAVISDAVNRPAPRIVSAIEDLAAKLHPEVFGAQTSAAITTDVRGSKIKSNQADQLCAR